MRRKKIVTISGGTGHYALLTGLKRCPFEITAIITMADDGGSTGVLRDELGVLPPGDVRQCLVALSEHSDIVRKLMSYRFENGGLAGHNFGNIFLAALEKVTGSFATGVEIASEILKVRGGVIPVTKDMAKLSIMLSDGELLEGENNIQNADLKKRGVKNIFYKNEVNLNENAKRAILSADYIILGPGNYYCSVVPNLIVNGFKDTTNKSKAKIIFPVNLRNKLEHTSGWKVSDYVKDIEKYLEKKVDYILVNDEKPSTEQTKLYELEEGKGVLVEDDLTDERVVRGKLLSTLIVKPEYDEKMQATRGFIRHDSKKLAECIKKIIRT